MRLMHASRSEQQERIMAAKAIVEPAAGAWGAKRGMQVGNQH